MIDPVVHLLGYGRPPVRHAGEMHHIRGTVQQRLPADPLRHIRQARDLDAIRSARGTGSRDAARTR